MSSASPTQIHHKSNSIWRQTCLQVAPSDLAVFSLPSPIMNVWLSVRIALVLPCGKEWQCNEGRVPVRWHPSRKLLRVLRKGWLWLELTLYRRLDEANSSWLILDDSADSKNDETLHFPVRFFGRIDSFCESSKLDFTSDLRFCLDFLR